jgi:DNA modification methylase
MPHQPRLIKDERAEYHVDDAKKAAYRERLRQMLQDPEFRQIEGFPIGEDEAILDLSDPPYYTACPNPFLPEIIAQWQAERQQLRAELGLDDDTYQREPFASDVSEGKNNPIYNAHSYHTKVPHKAIMRYILHYTDPGDVVFDGFCGTGMTGVAAQLCGDRQEVESLGYRVDADGVIYNGGEPIARLGARKAVLNDLSPVATFIAYNYNTPVDAAAFEQEAKRILREVEKELGWMYETWHPHCDDPNRVKGKINFTVWSDVFICSNCDSELVFWDTAVEKKLGKVLNEFSCPNCAAKQTKRNMKRAEETIYDVELKESFSIAKKVPVIINYSIGRKRYEKKPDSDDIRLLHEIESSPISYWFPIDRMTDGDESRRNDPSGLTHVHHFFSRRNLWLISAIWHRIRKPHTSPLCGFLFTSTLPWTTRQNRFILSNYFKKTGGVIAPNLPGTLYVSSLSIETNPLERFKLRIRSARYTASKPYFAVTCQSATTLNNIPDNSKDYLFIDPPFGDNIMYSELNFITESWLQIHTDSAPEAIINRTQQKKLPEYLRLMENSFKDFYRILKPGRWLTVEFHNSKNKVWNSIQQSILSAGFVIADVRILEKTHKTFKQVNSANAVRQDLAITAYKPDTSFEQNFINEAGSSEGVWQFVHQHLSQLPVVVVQKGTVETLSERQDYLLFDRMVAFHIQRGASVPLSAAEFYAGLRQRFVERDGMFFLPEQVPQYDKARLEAASVAQLTLFVSDEKSGIQWLRQQLEPSLGGQPQTYQQIQPQFLRQLHQARHEALPELSDILEQNFLQDEEGRWYVPDPNKASDLEKIRQKALLREFQQYTQGKKKLRQFRTEAVRAGFAHAWQEREYATIVTVAERLPELVLQEDPDLLMYYDNASLRT